jgi:hypothetical protein
VPLSVKVNLFFRQGEAGWSELYWRDGDADLQSGMDDTLRALIPTRKRLLGRDAQLIGVRLSDESILGDSILLESAQIPQVAQFDEPCDPPFSGLLVRYEASPNYRGEKALRGLPKTILTEPYGSSPLQGEFDKLFNLYAGIVKESEGQWRLRVRDKDLGTNPAKNVISVETDPVNAGFVRLTVPAHGFNPANKVSLTGLKFQDKTVKLKGTRFISFVTANTFSVLAPPITSIYVGFGKAKEQKFAYRPITSARAERISSHKVGRVFTAPHGRRSAKRP